MPTVRQRGDVFQAIVRIKQHGVLVYNEARSFPTERLARDWGCRLEAKLKKEGVHARLKSKTTLARLIQDYADARDEAKPLRRTARGELDQLIGFVGHMSLEDLAPETFVEFARRRRKEGAGPSTVLHNLATLRAVLNAARPMFGLDIDGEAVTDAINSLNRTGHVGRSAHRDRRVTPAELDLLIAEFNRIAPNPSTIIPMHDIVALAVALPRRLGELCAMRWTDYGSGIITLRDTKHPRRPRLERVPVPSQARAIIERQPRVDECILPYREASVSKAFQRACARLGIKDLRFHDLRHEGISRLFEQGLNIQEVAMISGHLSWTMLKRYTHLSPNDVLTKLDARQ